MKSAWPKNRTEMLIDQSKVNSDEKVLFRETAHDLGLEIRKGFAWGQLLSKFKFYFLNWQLKLHLNANSD